MKVPLFGTNGSRQHLPLRSNKLRADRDSTSLSDRVQLPRPSRAPHLPRRQPAPAVAHVHDAAGRRFPAPQPRMPSTSRQQQPAASSQQQRSHTRPARPDSTSRLPVPSISRRARPTPPGGSRSSSRSPVSSSSSSAPALSDYFLWFKTDRIPPQRAGIRYHLLPPFINIRYFSFVKHMYLDIF
jgi:hypothetical protein